MVACMSPPQLPAHTTRRSNDPAQLQVEYFISRGRRANNAFQAHATSIRPSPRRRIATEAQVRSTHVTVAPTAKKVVSHRLLDDGRLQHAVMKLSTPSAHRIT